MSFESNKIIAAILVSFMLAQIAGILAEKLVHPTMLAKNAYPIAGVAEASTAAEPAAPAGPDPVGPLLAQASADAGKNDTRVCTACHTFDKGQPNRIGPNLFGVVGQPIAEGHDNYAFSTALKGAGQGKDWTPDELNLWLFKPQSFAQGTKMTFVGVPKAKDRADIIAYLNSLSDSPKPLQAEPAPAPAGGTAPNASPAGAPPAGGGAK